MKLQSLQTGRAVACLLVLVPHLGGIITELCGIDKFGWMVSGYTGLNYFFVLIGFIIFYAHSGDISVPSQWLPYAKKRFIRIYPIYWVLLIIILSKRILFADKAETKILSLYSWVATFLLLPQVRNNAVASPVLGVAWTLEYEIIFYFYFLVLILNKKVGIVIGVAVILLHFCDFIYISTPYLLFIQQPYLIIFSFGVFAAWITGYEIAPSIYIPLGLLGGGIVTLLSIKESIECIKQNSMSHQLIFGIGFGLIVIFLVCMEKNGVIIGANKIFQLLGAASYSIYLVHIPLFWMIVSFLIKTHTGAYIISSFLIPVFIIIVLIGVASGIGLHFFVEKPLILFFRKRLHV